MTHDGVMSVSEVSALAEAALGGFVDIVTVLLNAGANVHFKSDVSRKNSTDATYHGN